MPNSESEGSWIGDKSPEMDGRRIEDDLQAERLIKTGTVPNMIQPLHWIEKYIWIKKKGRKPRHKEQSEHSRVEISFKKHVEETFEVSYLRKVLF